MKTWTPDSWKSATTIKQLPKYENENHLAKVQSELSNKLDIADYDATKRLKERLKSVNLNKAFLLMGGDCSEDLNNFKTENITKTLETILESEKILLAKHSDLKVIKTARMCGQYAKPRSSLTETINGVTLPSFQGEIVNGVGFDEETRKPNPDFMLKAYNASLNARNLIIKTNTRYFYLAHEAMLLPYEEPLIRLKNGEYYLSSANLPWLGYRTADLNGAHVEFLRGIINPIGYKVGYDSKPEFVTDLIKILNPKNEDGKIILIIRMGADKIKEYLPNFIDEMLKTNLNITWIVDPMHGNIKKLPNGYKTRFFNDILSETLDFISICKSKNVVPGGIHLEMTGLDVTECVGFNVNEDDITKNYTTLCDPRLNRLQTIELISQVAKVL